MGKISETRALVKFLSMEKKYSIRQIAKKAKISKSTVARYLNPSKKASKKNKQLTNTGRPKILSAHDIRLLKRSITQLRDVNTNFTVKELIRYSGLQTASASYSTFYREIKKMGFNFLNARKKGIVRNGINSRKNAEKF